MTTGLSACSGLTQHTFEDDAKVSKEVTSVRIDNTNGSVKVDATADSSVISVNRKVSYRGDEPSGTSFRVADGVLTLGGCGRNCGVSYVVKAPAGLPVTGGTSNGGIALTGVGPADVHTSNGNIEVTRAKGPVKLRTTNAEVTVTDVEHGGIDARTTNGEMTIRTANAQDIKARTTNAGLTVTAPPARYRISARGTGGEKRLAFRDDPSGGYRLDLSTTNGDLTLDSAR
ncbi:DUF4097 family beta strand repeat protein [Streptomyces sp. J2-1]|uniref:DUF4097 family beta strand repeat-containing protein n=1 Tax=Streptomyces corallincola TaxID=2851888 RepID=UPI001C3831C3|nr:DUF4097 family beta strand repeat-containing protein [Streptomyces corallincola]MBV2352871.1 DUF4097 family beta strand repeat protein [Streptomyces corallincola]